MLVLVTLDLEMSENSSKSEKKETQLEDKKENGKFEKKSDQFALIENIRTVTFLMDSHDSLDNSEKVPSTTNLILGRAVELLADNLYSKDVHFILVCEKIFW